MLYYLVLINGMTACRMEEQWWMTGHFPFVAAPKLALGSIRAPI